ncbi:MAG: hypothetical protein Kapaf2KO_00150 [Candidatus Kapaibacteriales bacterium]
MQPRIDHIQITVKDFQESEKYYDRLMPILGFDLARKGKGRVEAHDFDVIEYCHDNIVVGINSPRKSEKDTLVHRRRPGSLHHLAFRAEDRAEVDEVYDKFQEAGIKVLEPPRVYPQHGEHYYALFFKDPSGIKLELMHEGK